MSKSPLQRVQREIDKVANERDKADALITELQPAEMGDFLEHSRNPALRLRLRVERAKKVALDKELARLMRQQIILEGEARSVKAATKPKISKMDQRYKALEALRKQHPTWSLAKRCEVVADKEGSTADVVKKSYYERIKKDRRIQASAKKIGGNAKGDPDQAGQAQKK